MKILDATIIEQHYGPDLVSLRTDLTEACFPFKASLTLDFRCARGTARDYVHEPFPDTVIHRVREDGC